MVYFELVKVTIDAPVLAEVFLKILLYHHGLPDSIFSDQGLVFTSEFWFLLFYFAEI